MFRNTIDRYSSLKEMVTRIEALKFLLKKINASTVIIIGKRGLSAKCANVLGRSAAIQCKFIGTFKEERYNPLFPLMIYYFKRARSIIRSIVSRINYPSSRKGGASVIGMSYIRHYNETDNSLRLIEKREPTGLPVDSMLYPVLRQAQERYGKKQKIMYIDRRYPFQLKAILRLPISAFTLDRYIKIFDTGLWRKRKELMRKLKQIKGSKKIKDECVFREVDLWPLLRNYLEFLFVKQYPEAVECANVMDRMLLAEKPKVLLISDETGLYGRTLVLAARKYGIKTVGLQHGNIAFYEIEHYHLGEGPLLPCPVPDMTAIGGENDRQILLKSGLYNDHNIKVTGRSRYDSLARMDEYYDRKAIRKKYGIGNRKMVLLTTIRYPVIKDREVWLKGMVKASKDIEDAFFIVKPHPFEEVEMLQKIIKQFGGKNIRLVEKEVDTKELLFACDVAVNAGSTVGLEAILMGKPFVMVNLTGREDITPYADKRAAIPVRNESDIASELKKILDGQLPEYLDEGTSKFIEDYAFKMDGKASQRVVDLI